MCILLKTMIDYQVPESSYLQLSRPMNRNRRAVVLQMTQVAMQELYFGHVRSAIDSLKIVLSLLWGSRATEWL
jgi:hypothetical protein